MDGARTAVLVLGTEQIQVRKINQNKQRGRKQEKKKEIESTAEY